MIKITPTEIKNELSGLLKDFFFGSKRKIIEPARNSQALVGRT